jgi:hypothetical protein
MAEPLIFWTDGSCFEHCAVAAIAVVDHRSASVLATQVLWGCRSAFEAELEAIRLAFRLCLYIAHPQQIEVRSDCRPAVTDGRLTVPSGVRLRHGYRGDNKAHRTARELGKKAAALVSERFAPPFTTPSCDLAPVGG